MPVVQDVAWEIGRFVPYLRRYARVITGDRARGDLKVRDCLEQLLPLPDGLAATDVKVELYRALHDLLGAAGEDEKPGDVTAASLVENEDIVAARVERLGLAKQQILVLTALEGFSLRDAASVMGMSSAAAGALLRQAKDELRAQRASRILVIEDEPIIALDITATVEEIGHTVVGMAATHREAVEIAARELPDLVLADIQLAEEGSGLAAVRDILHDRLIPVVFITAFPERLLTGVRPELTYLVTKPFDAETLAVSISQALATSEARPRLLQ